jgi:tetratricopeptide (TPR) repeat protein
MVFTPEALPPPAMRVVRVTPPVPLAKARTQWAKHDRDRKTPPKPAKVTAAHVLASLLYEQAAAEPAQKSEPLGEARAVISNLLNAAGDAGGDRATLEMAAALSFAAGDTAAGVGHLDELVRRFPGDKAAGPARAQIAFAHLRAGKNAEAAAVVDGAQPSADAPELAYVIAWVRFRKGDAAGAADALELAMEKWPDAAYLDPLARDYLVMAARGGVSATDGALVIASLYPAKDLRFQVTHHLAQSYAFAGRPAEAAAAIELSLGIGADTLSADDKAALEKAAADLKTLARGKPPVESEAGDAKAYAHAANATVDARRQEVQACYEQLLQGDATLAGAMTLSLEVDAGGTVVGATSEPAEGEAGLAGVARCTVARARTWRFPSRPAGGVARVTAAFTLAVAK